MSPLSGLKNIVFYWPKSRTRSLSSLFSLSHSSLHIITKDTTIKQYLRLKLATTNNNLQHNVFILIAPNTPPPYSPLSMATSRFLALMSGSSLSPYYTYHILAGTGQECTCFSLLRPTSFQPTSFLLMHETRHNPRCFIAASSFLFLWFHWVDCCFHVFALAFTFIPCFMVIVEIFVFPWPSFPLPTHN